MKIRKWLWCPNCGLHGWHVLKKFRWVCEDCNLNNLHFEGINAVSQEEFLSYVRETVGKAGSDDYWKWKYEGVKDKTRAQIVKEVPYMAPGAIADDRMRGVTN